MKKTSTPLALGLLLGILAGLGTFATPFPAKAADEGISFEETRSWAVLADGRVKPLLTFANETVLSVAGRESLDGMSALEIFWGYTLAPQDFNQRPYIRVDSPALKREAGFDEGQRRLAFDALTNNAKFQELAQSALDRQRDEMDVTPLEKDALTVYNKLMRIASVSRGSALTVIPLVDANGNWATPQQVQASPDPQAQLISQKFGMLVAAYDAGDGSAFSRAATDLRNAFRSMNPSAYPTEKEIDRELFSEDFNAFGKAWKFYLTGTLLLLLLGFSANRWIYFSALGLLAGGFLCHSIGIGLRWAIAGFAPVSNMYESLVFMGWGVMAFGLIQEAIYKKRFFALAGGLMTFICLAFSENLPIDSSINPLVPVLAHTSWLAIHVITIMLSYSAFALAMGLGHFALFTQLWKPEKSDLIQSLSLLLYNTLQVGLLFLAAGIICGAVWANESWGRYWGWDPKETWSLITFFVYLVVVHAHFAGWLRDFGLAASSIIGFLSVIMTYYGVNYVLGAGNHSYGGDSQNGPLWMLLVTIVEVTIIAAAFLRYRQVQPTPDPLPAD